MNQLAKELKAYIRAKEGKYVDFCEKINMSYVTFNNIFNYDLVGAKVESLFRVMSELDLSLDALLYDGQIRPRSQSQPPKDDYVQYLTTLKASVDEELRKWQV